MATEMQKDVLLEILSGTYVLILRADSKEQKDLNLLLELKDELNSSYHYEVDYDSVLLKIQTLRAKYE